MSKSKIEWLDGGKTWNPVSGCTKCSPGCENCYAEKMARRLAGRYGYPADNPFRPGTLHPDKMDAPLHWKKPCKIFVCSMSDLFHDSVPFRFVHDILYSVMRTPQHTYQVLTKRPERMRAFFKEYLHQYEGDEIYDNLWLGVTVCNQAEANKKIPVLLDIPAVVRFVSIEPMLEPVDLERVHFAKFREGHRVDVLRGGYWNKYPHLFGAPSADLGEKKGGFTNHSDLRETGLINWVIVGGETGTNARPMNPDWARALRDQCRESDTPFFFKQMSNREPIPQDLMVREFPMEEKQ